MKVKEIVSETNPSKTLTKEEALDETTMILEPLIARFGKNQVFKQGLVSIVDGFEKGDRDAIMFHFKKTCSEFAPPSWMDHNTLRLNDILSRTPELKSSKPSEISQSSSSSS